jgi:hypothetical protein
VGVSSEKAGCHNKKMECRFIRRPLGCGYDSNFEPLKLNKASIGRFAPKIGILAI